MARYYVSGDRPRLAAVRPARSRARGKRKVLVIERSKLGWRRASSYKSGDLSSRARCIKPAIPHDPRDRNIAPLTRAGVIDRGSNGSRRRVFTKRAAVRSTTILASGQFRCGAGAPCASASRKPVPGSPTAGRNGAHSRPRWALSRKAAALQKAARKLSAPVETVICGPRLAPVAVAKADPGLATTKPSNARWRPIFLLFTTTRGAVVGVLCDRRRKLSPERGRYVQGGSQRALQRARPRIKVAGGEVLRCAASSAASYRVRKGSFEHAVTHTARDGTDAQTWSAYGSSAMRACRTGAIDARRGPAEN